MEANDTPVGRTAARATTLGRFILDLALCLCTTLQQSVESAAAGQ